MFFRTNQCVKILRNFATLAKSLKSLAIFGGLSIQCFAKFQTLNNYCVIRHIFIVVNGQILVKILYLVTLFRRNQLTSLLPGCYSENIFSYLQNGQRAKCKQNKIGRFLPILEGKQNYFQSLSNPGKSYGSFKTFLRSSSHYFFQSTVTSIRILSAKADLEKSADVSLWPLDGRQKFSQ